MAWDIIGHDWAVQLLIRHIENQQVRHAYLFTGPDSIGKRTIALRFAQALNCQSTDLLGTACGDCRACRLTQDGTFPDLHHIESAEDAAVIKVDQIRALQSQLALTPYEARWRIALLLRFHQAHISAANALLKTLEEPSPQVVILITARSAESLLPTIVSRCELFNLRAPTLDELTAALIDRGEGEKSARLLAGISNGRPGYAIRMLGNQEILDRRKENLDDFVRLLAQNRARRFAYVEGITRGRNLQKLREQVEDVLIDWVSLWRDVLMRTSHAEALTQNPDRQEDIERLAALFDEDQVYRALRNTMDSLEAIHRFGNIRMVLETLLLDFPQLA